MFFVPLFCKFIIPHVANSELKHIAWVMPVPPYHLAAPSPLMRVSGNTSLLQINTVYQTVFLIKKNPLYLSAIG